MNWDEIAYSFKTDKCSRYTWPRTHEEIPSHAYMEYYEKRLAQTNPANILEIGVLEGASLRMWAHLFPRAQVIGIDINPKCREQASERISIEILDVGDPEQIGEFATRSPLFDFIVDDGSHKERETITALYALWGRLIPHGLYAIEDVNHRPVGSPPIRHIGTGWIGWPAKIRDFALSVGAILNTHQSVFPDFQSVVFLDKGPGGACDSI